MSGCGTVVRIIPLWSLRSLTSLSPCVSSLRLDTSIVQSLVRLACGFTRPQWLCLANWCNSHLQCKQLLLFLFVWYIWISVLRLEFPDALCELLSYHSHMFSYIPEPQIFLQASYYKQQCRDLVFGQKWDMHIIWSLGSPLDFSKPQVTRYMIVYYAFQICKTLWWSRS